MIYYLNYTYQAEITKMLQYLHVNFRVRSKAS